jgi:hypothetical protein
MQIIAKKRPPLYLIGYNWQYNILVDFPKKFSHSIKTSPSGLNSESGVALKGWGYSRKPLFHFQAYLLKTHVVCLQGIIYNCFLFFLGKS